MQNGGCARGRVCKFYSARVVGHPADAMPRPQEQDTGVCVLLWSPRLAGSDADRSHSGAASDEEDQEGACARDLPEAPGRGEGAADGLCAR